MHIYICNIYIYVYVHMILIGATSNPESQEACLFVLILATIFLHTHPYSRHHRISGLRVPARALWRSPRWPYLLASTILLTQMPLAVFMAFEASKTNIAWFTDTGIYTYIYIYIYIYLFTHTCTYMCICICMLIYNDRVLVPRIATLRAERVGQLSV